MTQTQKEINAAQIVSHFIDGQLGDYSGYTTIIDVSELDDVTQEAIVDVNIQKDNENIKFLRFKVKDIPSGAAEDIEDVSWDLQIELHEDCWEDIASYDWTVKYFWMAFLEWA